MSHAVNAELVDDDEGREVSSGNLDSGGALSAVTKSEIDMQVSTAKKYPRVISDVVKKMESIACMDEETAASCFYTLPRGGKTIQGESVRLAEIAIACYQNLRCGTRVVAIDSDSDTPSVTTQAAFHDVENNVMITIEKRRRITKKKSKPKPDDDDIQLAVDACSSIALRNATFRVIPKSLIRRVYLKAKAVAVGDASTLVNKRTQVVERLQKMGPTLDRILAAVEAKRIEDIDLDKLEQLIGLGTAIKDGSITVDNAFPELQVTGGKVAESDVGSKFGKGKEDKPAEQNVANADAGKQAEPAGADDSVILGYEAGIDEADGSAALDNLGDKITADERLSQAQRDGLLAALAKKRGPKKSRSADPQKGLPGT